ncbi:heme-binding protein [Aurantiacibacter sp. D1-12]|uniref:heme-binding protein n=1 Tax=Aurantiacibacter sp. D1-12 TaxID=2993658 RepID=UPI00237CC9A8|nr:heme-binding protein [Aurantiacibacter sp. D1-12]MDE1467277.1 heme-binding protein [Aurantiacibacter sp. D1-12]
MRWRRATALLSASALVLAGCGGGGDGGQNGSGNVVVPTPSPTPPPSGQLFTPPAQEFLTSADVQTVIAQAVAEAQNRNLPSIIAVTDRVGNVLAVFAMNGAPDMTALSRQQIGGMAAMGDEIGLQGAMVPSTTAAIAKAITGAYLSSSGNAFTSRTASMIVQEHFPPAPTTVGLESGPLFGVQFSQLPCSDLSARASDGMIGPKRSPLGLSADPGGLPLYKNGVVVGGIGIMGDGDYGFDPNILDVENDTEEAIALAGAQGFMAPTDIRANRIFVDGTALRFTDVTEAQIAGGGGNFAAINGTAGNLVAVTGYTDGMLRAGTAYGTEASGIRASTPGEFSNRDAWVLTDGAGTPRYPIRAGTDAGSVAQPLSAAEVRAILEEAFTILSRARAQIRRPLDSRMQASISLVDTHGEVLGIVRSPDGPIFGVDVSLQKARTAAFFSNPAAAADLTPIAAPPGGLSGADYVNRVRNFLGDPNALTGNFAFADRSGGNLSRPYFPDGEVSAVAGPLSVQVPNTFSPFAVGLQTDLIVPNVGAHLNFVAGLSPNDTPRGCTLAPNSPSGAPRIANGIQIFPGSVPIYRGGELVGGIGVSGDGIDQDDMVSFLGLHNAGLRVGGIGNADPAIRADRIVVNVNGRNVRLRYVNCPFAPFLDTDTQNVCQGL